MDQLIITNQENAVAAGRPVRLVPGLEDTYDHKRTPRRMEVLTGKRSHILLTMSMV